MNSHIISKIHNRALQGFRVGNNSVNTNYSYRNRLLKFQVLVTELELFLKLEIVLRNFLMKWINKPDSSKACDSEAPQSLGLT
jgi:hypothetical protein